MKSRKKIASLAHPQPKLSEWLNVFQKWDNPERLLALNELIKLLEPSQIRQMMAVIEPLFQRDFISLLPKELALYVLWFLPPLDLLRSAQTCKKWRILAHDNLLWREKCRKLKIMPNLFFTDETFSSDSSSSLLPNESSNLTYSSFDKANCSTRTTAFDSHSTASPSSIIWKNVFIREKKVEYNWKCNSIKNIKVLRGHDEHVITCLQFDGKRIISGSDDNTLKVWCALTYKCLATLYGHSGGVWSSELKTTSTPVNRSDTSFTNPPPPPSSHNTTSSKTCNSSNNSSNSATTTTVNQRYDGCFNCGNCHVNNEYTNLCCVNNPTITTTTTTNTTTSSASTSCDSINPIPNSNSNLNNEIETVQSDSQQPSSSSSYDLTEDETPQMVLNDNTTPEYEQILLLPPPLKTILPEPTHPEYIIDWDNMEIVTVVSGSTDRTLKVWEILVPIDPFKYAKHVSSSMEMVGTDISMSTNQGECLWKCVHTLYGHTSTVRCMSIKGDRVVSGSRDATLRLWNIVTGECLGVMLGHVAAVRCVAFDGKKVVSGAYDYTVKVWDARTLECVHTLRGHSNRVYSLQFDGIHVVSGSLDTTIRVWDVETGVCIHTLVGHQSLTSRMELKDNILVSGNADSTVKIWDIKTGQCIHTFHGPNKHQSAVTCLQLDRKAASTGGTVVTSSDDGTVKLWDLQTGDFIRNLVQLDSGGSGGVVWRIKANTTKLVCAIGSRNGTEDTKLLVLNFDSSTPRITTPSSYQDDSNNINHQNSMSFDPPTDTSVASDQSFNESDNSSQLTTPNPAINA